MKKINKMDIVSETIDFIRLLSQMYCPSVSFCYNFVHKYTAKQCSIIVRKKNNSDSENYNEKKNLSYVQ